MHHRGHGSHGHMTTRNWNMTIISIPLTRHCYLSTDSTMPPPLPAFSFDGDVAIVAGAGSRLAGEIGNGRATAILLARQGAKVALLDYNVEWAQETKRMINEEGGVSEVIQCDVTEEAACENADCSATFEVGVGGPHGNVTEVDLDAWDRDFRINVTSMVMMSRYAIPEMKKVGRGAIATRAAARDRVHGSTAPVARVPCPFRWGFFGTFHGAVTARFEPVLAVENTAVTAISRLHGWYFFPPSHPRGYYSTCDVGTSLDTYIYWAPSRLPSDFVSLVCAKTETTSTKTSFDIPDSLIPPGRNDASEIEFYNSESDEKALPAVSTEGPIRRSTRKRQTDKLTAILAAEHADEDGNPQTKHVPRVGAPRAPRVKTVPETPSEEEDDDFEMPDLRAASDSEDSDSEDEDVDNDEFWAVTQACCTPSARAQSSSSPARWPRTTDPTTSDTDGARARDDGRDAPVAHRSEPPPTGGDGVRSILFLASREARWIMGVIFPVDGGTTSANPNRPALKEDTLAAEKAAGFSAAQ
ncbi:hypothetical protein C8R44DRAFT_952191 [Mycena epipterygia]|nr:hypothetical protein C8R44DRAFT_952191 [Mycena epipterygia]